MSYSRLTNKYIPAHSSNYSQGRAGRRVLKITPHHMAGNLSIEQCGAIFQTPGRGGSSNYGIGTDGRIACYVDEENRSWCSSSGENDNQAITVEIANDGGANTNWHISDRAIEAFINLAVDICKRYGIARINYTGDATGNMTRHNMFVATTCPGGYFQSKMPSIANEINKRLGGDPTPTPTPASFAVGDKVVPKAYVDYYGTPLMKTRDFYYISQISGDRAVLNADSVNGTVYCAMNTNNLTKVSVAPTPAPAPAPTGDFKYGDSVIVNGVGTADSYGGGARTGNYVNHRAKVMGAKQNGRYPLNCNNDLNGVTGWFPEGNIRRA